MRQNDNELLIKDLCTRLPYGVKCKVNYIINNETTYGEDIEKECTDIVKRINFDNYTVYTEWLGYDSDIEDVKPYLRSMSSMTEEEAKELSILYGLKDILSIKKITDEYIEVVVDDGFCSTETGTIWYDEIISSIEIFDWLNAHYFDYRGLILNGLAIAVTKENNPYK